MKKKIIDAATGEIIDTLNTGDRILRKASIERLENYQKWNIKHFYKANIDELKQLNKDLTISEAGFLFKILPYINYEDCLLCHKNGKDINGTDLSNISGLSYNRTLQLLAALIKKDVLYKGKHSKGNQYFVNPYLFVRGNKINTVLKTMFKNYKVRVVT